ncbi:hypothetical protein lerEdw1_016211 [Lerista edwardsae]|nr:hypothetical protein lerEdw1_016211 [Lerista edwardsae]
MSEPRDRAAAAPQGGCGGAGRGAVLLSLLFSLLSVGACFLLSAKTSKLQGRLMALEEELASRAWSPGAPLGAEPLLALLQPQVDELLQEKNPAIFLLTPSCLELLASPQDRRLGCPEEFCAEHA